VLSLPLYPAPRVADANRRPALFDAP
jgi:hypothetical protein